MNSSYINIIVKNNALGLLDQTVREFLIKETSII